MNRVLVLALFLLLTAQANNQGYSSYYRYGFPYYGYPYYYYPYGGSGFMLDGGNGFWRRLLRGAATGGLLGFLLGKK
uniref:Secreted protein n=1 Tax=Angiostrongylus cantonensis TaxID=6313 RepID=A0A0K0D7K2_ANGCA